MILFLHVKGATFELLHLLLGGVTQQTVYTHMGFHSMYTAQHGLLYLATWENLMYVRAVHLHHCS